MSANAFELLPSLQPREPAPAFTLAAIHRDGTAERAVEPTEERQQERASPPVARLGLTATKLERLGVETLSVVATDMERARLYFRDRPTKLSLAADAGATLLLWFQLPQPEPTGELMEMIRAVPVSATGELPQAMHLFDAANALDAKDGYERTAADEEEAQQVVQFVGQFFLDRAGIIRWVNIEGAEGIVGLGKFPTDEQFMAAATTATG
jgi:hypothetical protein